MRLFLFAAFSFCATCASASEPTRIPLVAGLTEVSAVQSARGDREQVVSVTGASSDFVDFAVEFAGPPANPKATVTWTRQVRREDLAKSNRLNIVFQEGDSPVFPASTLVHLSSATLAALKQSGQAAMVFGYRPGPAGNSSTTAAFSQVPSGRKYYRGFLRRDTAKPASLTVVVNGKRLALPVVHASGTFTVAGESVDLELSVIDDPANPLILALKYDKYGSSTVRIEFPTSKPKAFLLAMALSGGGSDGGYGGGYGGGSGGTCRTELSGIYFDFAQATLLPQSQPALSAVAEMMRTHPTWRLRIEGHTDNVGTADFNQALSQRRSSAVLAALTSVHKVSAERLTAAGWGASRPVASNDTLEGRAENRRVELSRTCP